MKEAKNLITLPPTVSEVINHFCEQMRETVKLEDKVVEKLKTLISQEKIPNPEEIALILFNNQLDTTDDTN